MKFGLFWGLCLAFAFVVESFEEETVLEDEQGKESFEEEAVNVLADEQGKESFEDEAVLEGEQENKPFEHETVLEDDQGKESFEDEAVLADELGKESFDDEAVLEDEQENDKRRLGQRCRTDADCERGECCGRFGLCRPKGKFCRTKFCKTDADCDQRECCGRFGLCRPKISQFCRPKPSCKTDADCARGECCFRVGLLSRCRPKRGLGQFCHPKSTCLLRCQDHLECRSYRCLVPLPPTPTTVVPTTASA